MLREPVWCLYPMLRKLEKIPIEASWSMGMRRRRAVELEFFLQVGASEIVLRTLH